MSDVSRGYSYGLREIVLVSDDGGTTVTLPASRTLSFSETFTEAELEGDDKVVSAVAFPKSLEFELEAGGISLEALALMLGESVSLSGVTPNQIEEMVRHAGTSSPYFKIMGRSLGDDGDSVHVIVYKAKITAMEGNFAFEEFHLTQCSGKAIDDGDGLYSIKKLETDAALS